MTIALSVQLCIRDLKEVYVHSSCSGNLSHTQHLYWIFKMV